MPPSRGERDAGRVKPRRRVVPDVNLLLFAYDSESPYHRAAAAWWSGLLSAGEPVGLCPVVVFGFLRLATSSRVFEQPLTLTEATSRVRSWIVRPMVQVLYPGPKHLETVCNLLEVAGIGGNLVTDAQIAALAIEHEAEVHSTDADFGRFAGLRWRNPLVR